MRENIYNYLAKYINKGIYPFHMPGHKGNLAFFKDFDFLKYDATEFGEMDNLHDANGIIKNSEEFAARLYGAKRAYFFTNGASSGMLAAILASFSEGDLVWVWSGCHKCVYHGLILSGALPKIFNYISDIDDFNAKGIIINSITYMGFATELKKIFDSGKFNSEKINFGSDSKKSYVENSKLKNFFDKALVIADEAHGAHFIFSDYFPQSAVPKADITVVSPHKTLPCLGQSAILFSNIENPKINFCREIFNTSSPSYLMMAVMDRTLWRLNKNPEIYEKYIKELKNFRALASSRTFRLAENDDKSKLLFYINSDTSGFELEKILARDYKIQVEMAGEDYILALSTVCDAKEGFEALLRALKDIKKDIKVEYARRERSAFRAKREIKIPPKLAIAAPEIRLNIETAVGRVAAEFITPYPPGVPELIPGEVISEELGRKYAGRKISVSTAFD